MPVSMSAGVASPRSTMRMASARYGTSRRFTTKPGVSAAATGTLPQASPKALASAKTSSLVCLARTTSTSFMSWTGLKKCRPTMRCGRPEAVPISPIEKDEVLLAKIVVGLQTPLSSLEELLLDVEVLDDGLDHEVAVGQVLEARACRGRGRRRRRRRRATTFSFSTSLSRLRRMRCDALVQGGLLRLADHDRAARPGRRSARCRGP